MKMMRIKCDGLRYCQTRLLISTPIFKSSKERKWENMLMRTDVPSLRWSFWLHKMPQHLPMTSSVSSFNLSPVCMRKNTHLYLFQSSSSNIYSNTRMCFQLPSKPHDSTINQSNCCAWHFKTQKGLKRNWKTNTPCCSTACDHLS